jgi:hypothetical protein
MYAFNSSDSTHPQNADALHLQEDSIILYGFSDDDGHLTRPTFTFHSLRKGARQVHAFEEVLWTYGIPAPKERANRNILVVAPVERPKHTRANVDISSTP